jgi:hypothetical protein
MHFLFVILFLFFFLQVGEMRCFFDLDLFITCEEVSEVVGEKIEKVVTISSNINHFGSTKKNLPFYSSVKTLDNKNEMNINTTGSLSTTKLTSFSWVNNALFTTSTTTVKRKE